MAIRLANRRRRGELGATLRTARRQLKPVCAKPSRLTAISAAVSVLALSTAIPAALADDLIPPGLLGTPPALPAPSAQPSQTEIDQARQYADCMNLAQSDPGKALKAARIWERKAGGAPAGHCAAVALVGLGQYKEAGDAMEKLAADELKDRKDLAASLYGQAAQAWVLAGDNGRAVKDETAAIQLVPDDPEMLVDRGIILASTGKYFEAIDDFGKAHDLAGNRADILVFRATAYRKLKSFDLANDDIDRAIQLQPKNADAYLERGIIRMLRKDVEGAKADWQRVVELGRRTPAAQTAEANLKQLAPPPAPAKASSAPAKAAPPVAPAPEAPPAQPIDPQLPLDASPQ
jgi:Flp pilus assembly protein TadD